MEDPAGPRNLLAVQDFNRKGRLSPLPQAVQGAQRQQPGPAAEPGIKSEFGRMFSGIGSGVSAIGVSSPITSGVAPAPYTNAALAKREDVEGGAAEPGADGPGKGNKGRARKLKEEDRGDDENSGRVTPGKAKRAKGPQHHHHQYVPATGPGKPISNKSFSHHHHHHHHGNEASPSAPAGLPPVKNPKNGQPVTSPTDKSLPGPHHHHHHHVPRTPAGTPSQPAKQGPPSPPVVVVPPKAKTTISSKAVLDAVSSLPRHHLGDSIYEPELRAERLVPEISKHRGFSSNPKPLPWDTIKGKENCTLTVKVSRIHLSPAAREEVTARRYLWGTDVYTDDSDVVAACIHGGWIKGEWTEDVDVAMLDVDSVRDPKRGKPASQKNDAPDADLEGLISEPSASGPMTVPANRDLHVSVVVLPRLVKYAATTRFGMTSREFGGEVGPRHLVHDGLSYMIQSIRWVENGAQPQSRLRGKARRERMRRAMNEVNGSFGNITNSAGDGGGGPDRDQEKAEAARLRGEISGSWRKRGGDDADNAAADGKDAAGERGASEGDKENRLVGGGGGDKAVEAKGDEEEAAKQPLGQDVEMADVETAAAKTGDGA